MSDNLLNASPLLETDGFASRLTAKKTRSVAITLDILVLFSVVLLGAAVRDPQVAAALPASEAMATSSLMAELRLAFSYPPSAWFLSAIAAAVYVPALYLAGTYQAATLLQPSRSIVRVLMLWILCLATVSGLFAGAEIKLMLSLLQPIDASFPFAVLISRGVTAMLVAWCGCADRLRAENILFLIERASAHPYRLETSQDQRLTFCIPSFANISESALRQLIATSANARRNEIVLIQGAASIADCKALAGCLRMTDLRIELLATMIQPEMADCLVRQSASGYRYELQRAPINEGGLRAKRAMDFWGATALFFIMAPLLLLIAIAVKTTSKGPVLYAQTRTGRNGQTFTILKFRTMILQRSGDGVIQAVRGDRRVTPLGRWLRLTSLDELPQLINVIRGEMSLIGPRPHAVAHDRLFSARFPDYEMRFRVRPGISGLAQVCGYRGETSTDDAILNRVALDLRYINDWSLRGDLYIVFRTLLAVIVPQNAY